MILFTLQTQSRRICLLRNSASPFCVGFGMLLIRKFVSLGRVESGTAETVEIIVTDQEKARQERMNSRPPLSEILNLHDFEVQ